VSSIQKKNEIDIFIYRMGFGGSERVCANLCNQLVENGHSINLIIINGEASCAYAIDPRVKIKNFQAPRVIFSVHKIFNYLKKSNSKIGLSFGYELCAAVVIAKLLLSKKYSLIARNINSITEYGENEGSFFRRKLINKISFYFFKKSDYIINQCAGMQNDLLESGGVSAKLRIINNPVSPIFNSYQPLTLNQHKPYILVVGRICEQKNIRDAILAYSYARCEIEGLNLIIVGDGEQKPELIDYINKIGLTGEITFVSSTKNISDFYYWAEATILTSKYEGFPNVLLESISIGTGVIAYDCKSGPSEIIIEGVNGYLAKYMDPKDLANKVIRWINSGISKDKVKSTSIRYSCSEIASQYEELFKDALSQ
jgi:glycosyltransferase involved in cell wall biosynthesis